MDEKFAKARDLADAECSVVFGEGTFTSDELFSCVGHFGVNLKNS